jgi:DNA (cytosine-5)-methyltransferase 1
MTKRKSMRGGTLFSGIGTPELAAPWVDWRWCAEIDPFACAVLAARFSERRNLGDVRTIATDAVEPVDLIVFGSPCQSFSVAGKRAGLGRAPTLNRPRSSSERSLSS